MKANSLHLVAAAAAFGLLTPPAASAFNVGKRRIRCVPLASDPDALALDPSLTVPSLTAFVGAQAALPSLARCPPAVQLQAPWYAGGDGPGFCPVAYWDAAALAPGVLLLCAAVALRGYILERRLVVTATAVRTGRWAEGEGALADGGTTLMELADVGAWSCGPLGLALTSAATGERVYVPPFWHAKDVEALLGDRIP